MTEIENNMINMDLYEVFEFPKCVLNIYGLWPKNKTIFARIRGIIAILNSSIFVGFLAAECIFGHNDFETVLEVLTTFTCIFSYVLKFFVFSGLEKDFLELYKFLEYPKFRNIPKSTMNEISKPIKIAKTIIICYQINCFLTATLYTVMPTITSKSLPVRFTITHLGNWHAVMYLFQGLALHNSASNNCSIDCIALGLMCIVKGQICVLIKKIRSIGLFDEKTSDDSHLISYMRDIVVHHNKVIMLVQRIEKVFSMIVLIQYLTSIMVICNSGIQLVTVKVSGFPLILTVTFFIAMMCQLGMYCWFGNEIILHSSAISDACYNSNWISANQEIKKMLLIIMERSKTPLYLTAGKFSIVSLKSFTSVINSAYSFFALMQRMYGKHEEN